MIDIRAVAELFLAALRDLVALLDRELTFAELEEGVQQVSARLTLGCLEQILAAVDEQLMHRRDRRRLELVGVRVRELDTPMGTLRVPRRYYRDRCTGEGVFLLDDALGLETGRRLSRPRPVKWCKMRSPSGFGPHIAAFTKALIGSPPGASPLVAAA